MPHRLQERAVSPDDRRPKTTKKGTELFGPLHRGPKWDPSKNRDRFVQFEPPFRFVIVVTHDLGHDLG